MAINYTYVIFILAAALGSGMIIFFIRRNPEGWGIKPPITLKHYLPALIPFVVVTIFIVRDAKEDMTALTGLEAYGEVLIVRGHSEIVQERIEDEVPISRFINKLTLVNKQNGEIIKRFSGVKPLYRSGSKLLCFGDLTYQVLDVATGETVERMTEADIRKKVEALGVSVFSMELDEEEAAFRIRTTKDEHLTFDPVGNQLNPTATTYLFSKTTGALALPASDLFQPEMVEFDEERIVVVSHEDLNRDYFILSAFDRQGTLLWTKPAHEISPKLAGTLFKTTDLSAVTAMDADAFYFVVSQYLVCVQAQTGELRWIVDF
jgi:hypothetical protein